MKTILLLLSIVPLLLFFLNSKAQLTVNDFFYFQAQTENLSNTELDAMFPRAKDVYYKKYNLTPELNQVLYFDSIDFNYHFTNDEKQFLSNNHFFVSERFRKSSFGGALTDVYIKDLPVFISTDLVLHGLHMSYDVALKTVERELMVPNLNRYLLELYNMLPTYYELYGDQFPEQMQDIDLYITTGLSLIQDQKKELRYGPDSIYQQVLEDIESLTFSAIPLFTYGRLRSIDFSQFKVRGHYVKENSWDFNLEPYFRTMMWLGRIEFLLTSPPDTPWEQVWDNRELRRMNIDAYILNEMMNNCTLDSLFQTNETIINYFVGESDNVTPAEYNEFILEMGVDHPNKLNVDTLFHAYYDSLKQKEEFQQKIMGGAMLVNPDTSILDGLPVTFKMAGQRYIIDSEIFTNVVYDRIVYNGVKMKRSMPDPLDALFCLGNSDAAYFLDERETFHYDAQLARMRFLVEQKNDDFWNNGLYNNWLGSIRELNAPKDNEKQPFFMRTGAWHQQKMNTQLYSWTELRHDNLLYAKPSYSGMSGCSFPLSYVEPYPEFYRRLKQFAENAADFFETLDVCQIESGEEIDDFFRAYALVMEKLEVLAEKELNGKSFTVDEKDWLSKMMYIMGGSSAPPVNGWLKDLFLDVTKLYLDPDFVTVDLHTAPTDEFGNVVGEVLHTGTGEINLGVVMAKIPGSEKLAAYVGAFGSYYEQITNNFYRMTDQEWSAKVEKGDLPERPLWTHAYLLDRKGEMKAIEKALPTEMLVENKKLSLPSEKIIRKIYPQPVDDYVYLDLNPELFDVVHCQLMDELGRRYMQFELNDKNNKIDIRSCKPGIYLLKCEHQGVSETIKLIIK